MPIANIVTDLPTELLLEITSYLGFEGISQVRLALTCRRFYETLIPQILEDQIKHADKLVAASRVHLIQDLSANEQGTDKATVGSITEPFKGFFRRLAFRVGGDEKDFRCVQGLITRAKHLEEVDLQLGEVCSLREVAAVLNSCIGRPGLRLSVGGTISSTERGPFEFDFRSNGKPIRLEELVTPPPSPPITETAKHYFWSFLRVLQPFFRASQGQVIPSAKNPPARKEAAMSSSPVSREISVIATLRNPRFHISTLPQPQLISFIISSEALFLPSIYPVTLNALNNSPIRTLSLSNLTLSLFDWAQILPSITLPFLENLMIGNLSLGFPDFLAFLERHDSIESIDLTGNNVIGVARLPLKPILPRLNSLTANHEYLVPFLLQKDREYFPALQKLGILSPGGISSPSVARYPYPEHQLHAVYDLISQGRFIDLSITLDLSTAGLIDWILNTPEAKDTGRQLLGVRSVVATCHGIHLAPNAVQEWMSRHSSLVGGSPTNNFSQFSEDPMPFVEILIRSASPHLEVLTLGDKTYLL
ncbi:hypothetical protein GALMADRAFT_155581 [Galerina marginata CBS 339.88]|uniref:F-box domain-containing protein n=1 Tax=Galerina marginata (strain CBS 339.88) TaxID=685588 RepID=A0A067TAE9_GALM3|nr:hypothetical protein GALMADRAFT_155581 [Galerina marginata CBS 339.88]